MSAGADIVSGGLGGGQHALTNITSYYLAILTCDSFILEIITRFVVEGYFLTSNSFSYLKNHFYLTKVGSHTNCYVVGSSNLQ